MKKYIIINGTIVIIVERENMEAARGAAIKVCDLSKEVIVREMTDFKDYTKQVTK